MRGKVAKCSSDGKKLISIHIDEPKGLAMPHLIIRWCEVDHRRYFKVFNSLSKGINIEVRWFSHRGKAGNRLIAGGCQQDEKESP